VEALERIDSIRASSSVAVSAWSFFSASRFHPSFKIANFDDSFLFVQATLCQPSSQGFRKLCRDSYAAVA
jgi:hypothetical protein